MKGVMNGADKQCTRQQTSSTLHYNFESKKDGYEALLDRAPYDNPLEHFPA